MTPLHAANTWLPRSRSSPSAPFRVYDRSRVWCACTSFGLTFEIVVRVAGPPYDGASSLPCSIRPNLARCLPSLSNFDQRLARFDQSWRQSVDTECGARLRSSSARFAQSLGRYRQKVRPGVGRIRHGVDRIWPTSAEFDPNSTKACWDPTTLSRFVRDLARIGPNLARLPEVVPMSTKLLLIRPILANFGRVWLGPVLGRRRPKMAEFDRTWTDFG